MPKGSQSNLKSYMHECLWAAASASAASDVNINNYVNAPNIQWSIG